MQQNPTNFFEWTQKYSTQEVCLEELSRHHWKGGFICPKCSHDKSCQLKYRHLHECAKCGRQVSPTASTVFEHTRLPLPKWFAAHTHTHRSPVSTPSWTTLWEAVRSTSLWGWTSRPATVTPPTPPPSTSLTPTNPMSTHRPSLLLVPSARTMTREPCFNTSCLMLPAS